MHLRIVLLMVVMLCTGFTQSQETMPNIILILADDLGYGDPRCYNGDSKISTPNIDSLAKGGLQFTDAHSPSAVCTPTRYGILTGQYAWRTALKKGVLWPWDRPLIDPEILTLPELLKGAGYTTACIGKWHLGWTWSDSLGHALNTATIGVNDRAKQLELSSKIDFRRPIGGGPLEHGFDYYFGDDVPNFPPYVFIENDHTLGIPNAQKPADMFGHDGPALPGWDLSVVMPVLTQKACSFIEQQRVDQPFFLYVPLTAPHTPIAPSPHFIGKSGAGLYGDYVTEVDWTVGQIMSALGREGLADNTLVIFTSDNGSPQRDGQAMSGQTGSVKAYGHDPSKPWRGMKSDIWEGGHRIPCIAWWPDRVPAGQVTTQPFILVDIMRTLASLVGARIPDGSAADSYDFSTVYLGSRQEDSPVRDHMIHHSGNGIFAIRRGDWKLILGKDSGGFTRYIPPDDAPEGQLYNLKDDPGEQTNVYNSHPEMVARLTQFLESQK